MKKTLILAVAATFLFPLTAHAYIDPGSGSAIMSVIIGFFVAAGLMIKTFWYKIKSVFTGKKRPESKQTDSDPDV